MTRRAIALLGLVAAGLLYACGGGDGGADPEPEPGTLQVRFTTPHGDDAGLLFRLTGPGIQSLTAPGLQLFESGSPTSRRVLVAGAVRNGVVLRFDVPDVEAVSSYSVTLEQVAGERFEQRSPSEYGLTVVR